MYRATGYVTVAAGLAGFLRGPESPGSGGSAPAPTHLGEEGALRPSLPTASTRGRAIHPRSSSRAPPRCASAGAGPRANPAAVTHRIRECQRGAASSRGIAGAYRGNVCTPPRPPGGLHVPGTGKVLRPTVAGQGMDGPCSGPRAGTGEPSAYTNT
eukprot:scaffold6198_cov408-Prasinococcus_capsulatus_cf.AAC.10